MAAAPAIPVNLSWTERVSALEPRQRFRIALGIALFLAIAVIGMVMGRQAEWRVLYSNLADKDGGAVIAQLTQMNVPYKYSEGGGAILVPADKVHDARMRLAAQGLPKGSVSGFESMDANRFGMTQFQERLSYQRGLEGELTRSIQAFTSVQSARVHLALPNQNGFFREQQKPSASVVISLNGGRTLDRGQIAGIVHLVSGSVPEMNPSAVSVLDDTGKLLSAPGDGSNAAAGGADSQQLQYVQQLETQYTRRILDILEPVVGRQNVRAQVTVDVDFSQTESTSESHKPNQAPDASTIRSQQVVESGAGAGGNAAAGGIPGATSNQPPSPPSAPINGAAQAVSAVGSASGAAGSGGAGAGAKRESITNYEVDKTVRVVKGATGVVKRLSAAVVLNNQTTTDDKGKTTTTPLTEQQIQRMTALVRETIGFSQDRGDSVNLMNAPFTVEKPNTVDVPLWKQAETQDLARSLAWPVGTLLLAALVLMGLVRPGMKVLTQQQGTLTVGGRSGGGANGGQLDALVAEENERPQLAGPGGSGTALVTTTPVTEAEQRLDEARKLTRDNPAAVANIVKTWINGEVPA